MTKSLVKAQSEMPISAINDVAFDVDSLNKAWGELTNQLVRQREVMRETIDDLHRKLADERKVRGG